MREGEKERGIERKEGGKKGRRKRKEDGGGNDIIQTYQRTVEQRKKNTKDTRLKCLTDEIISHLLRDNWEGDIDSGVEKDETQQSSDLQNKRKTKN